MRTISMSETGMRFATEAGTYRNFTGMVSWGRNYGWVREADFELVMQGRSPMVIFAAGTWRGFFRYGEWVGGTWQGGAKSEE